jgi:hypothetical protein
MLGRGFCLTSASVPAEWDAPVPSGRRGVSFARTVAALVLPADSLVSAGLASLVLVLSVFDLVAHLTRLAARLQFKEENQYRPSLGLSVS